MENMTTTEKHKILCLSPEVSRILLVTSVGPGFHPHWVKFYSEFHPFFKGCKRAAFVQAFLDLAPCNKDPLIVFFFNLQIFAFSDQMYMSLKNTKEKNILLLAESIGGLQQKLAYMNQPAQVQLKQRQMQWHRSEPRLYKPPGNTGSPLLFCSPLSFFLCLKSVSSHASIFLQNQHQQSCSL